MLTAEPLISLLYSSLKINLKCMIWVDIFQAQLRTSDFGLSHVGWRKWPTSFSKHPCGWLWGQGSGPIGESLERCFRAQWWCYHIVSGLNGLPTVCLKGSHNDRDQLIMAFATHCRQTLSWMNKCLCAFIKTWVVRTAHLQGQWNSFTRGSNVEVKH